MSCTGVTREDGGSAKPLPMGPKSANVFSHQNRSLLHYTHSHHTHTGNLHYNLGTSFSGFEKDPMLCCPQQPTIHHPRSQMERVQKSSALDQEHSEGQGVGSFHHRSNSLVS